MKNLGGKTALITGASRGLGVHLARALADRGVHLALVARTAGDLERIRAELAPKGVKVLCVPVDLTDRVALQSVVERVVGELGSIDLLINNAGLEQGALYTEYPRESLQRIIDVNLTAPMMLTSMVLPHMLARGEGHVVNIASVAGIVGVAYNEAYATTKHGIVGFTRSLAATAEGEGWPVGFSCILPGFIADTGMYEDMKQLTGSASPFIAGTSSPQTVVSATLKAIERNRLEVVVNPIPFRPLAIFLLVFPNATRWALRVFGSVGWFRAVALARRRARPSGPAPLGMPEPPAEP
jgi:short-subunit dehydrogenase